MSPERCVLHLVEREQPLHVELLCQRLAPALGRSKVTSVVRETADRAIEALMAANLLRREGAFLSLPKAGEVRPRRPAAGTAPRQIEHIAPKELEAALLAVAEQSFGLTPTALLDETSKAFGYARRGERITTALEAAYRELMKEGRLCLLDGKVRGGTTDA